MKKLFFFFVLAITAATAQAQTLASAKVTTVKQLHWETMTHDFGLMEQAKAQSAIFKFQNNTDEVVFIKSVKPSCGCTVAEYTRTAVAPGDWAEIKASYNAATLGQFRKTLQLTTSASDEVIVLTITGEVK